MKDMFLKLIILNGKKIQLNLLLNPKINQNKNHNICLSPLTAVQFFFLKNQSPMGEAGSGRTLSLNIGVVIKHILILDVAFYTQCDAKHSF